MSEIDEEANGSPVPEDVPAEVQVRKLLNFNEAMRAVLEEKKITREDWESEDYYGLIVDSRLKLHKPNEKMYDWIISEADLEGEDYYVIS